MNAGRVHANIDLNAILYNMDSMHRNLKKGTKMAAVIKTNAYGHGAKEISEVLEPLDYLWGYAVATVDEVFAAALCGEQNVLQEEKQPAIAAFAPVMRENGNDAGLRQ